jgi:hypothetical protein
MWGAAKRCLAPEAAQAARQERGESGCFTSNLPRRAIAACRASGRSQKPGTDSHFSRVRVRCLQRTWGAKSGSLAPVFVSADASHVAGSIDRA